MLPILLLQKAVLRIIILLYQSTVLQCFFIDIFYKVFNHATFTKQFNTTKRAVYPN